MKLKNLATSFVISLSLLFASSNLIRSQEWTAQQEMQANIAFCVHLFVSQFGNSGVANFNYLCTERYKN
jgi:hypothetical protein